LLLVICQEHDTDGAVVHDVCRQEQNELEEMGATYPDKSPIKSLQNNLTNQTQEKTNSQSK
jgi:hypothetical protein